MTTHDLTDNNKIFLTFAPVKLSVPAFTERCRSKRSRRTTFKLFLMQNKLLEESIQQFMTLPGIGRKTAQRFVLHLLRKSLEDVSNFTETIQRMKENIKFYQVCNNISENDICEICANLNRDHSTVCVVENINDVMAIEATRIPAPSVPTIAATARRCAWWRTFRT